MLFYLTLITLLTNACLSLCFTDDEVSQLPGLSAPVAFRQYSGYLNASKGHYLHYWFVESQSKPSEDPVILWLNGGPGCSSLLGFWTENGPFIVEWNRNVRDGYASDGDNRFRVTEAENSWNRLANVLYLESPVGVGFSYSDDMTTVHNSDDTTAEDNYLALLSFFEKYPKFKNNSFYITGESYAGVYIPTLAVRIFRSTNSGINLKGLAIGNGLLDGDALSESFVQMIYTHGLIDAKRWHELISTCCTCNVSTDAQVCDFSGNCSLFIDAYREAAGNVVDMYNILSDCSSAVGLSFADSPYAFDLKTRFGLSYDAVSRLQSPGAQCKSDAFKAYLNTIEVQKALNVQALQQWEVCSEDVHNNYNQQHRNMRSEMLELIEKYRIESFIIYNGDLDIVCDFLGDQHFVDSLELKLMQTYRKWTVNGRIAGFVKRYEGITFMTVRNAGHMVPSDQPEAALAIIEELVGVSKVNTF